MLMELNGVWLQIQQGRVLAWAHEPQCCPSCRRMTCGFINRAGRSVCVECADNQRKEQQS